MAFAWLKKLEKKDWLISSIAGLAILVIGYLVWRHEQSISSASNNAAATAANDAAQTIQSELDALPTYSGESSGSDGGDDSGTESVPEDSNLAAILAAFEQAAGGSTPTSPTGGSTSNNGGSGSTSGTGTAGSGTGSSMPTGTTPGQISSKKSTFGGNQTPPKTGPGGGLVV